VGPAATFQTCLPHFWHEARVALAEREDAVGRRALVVDAFGPGGELERVTGSLLIEAVSAHAPGPVSDG
jgi:hypothetical protein